jgi:hypothetical protein
MEDNKEKGMQLFTFSTTRNNTPTFTEAGRKDWINFGDDNLYPQYLVSLMDSSSKHNAIIKRKTDMSAGNGWEETTGNATFIKNEFGKENLNKIAYKNSYDLNLYGGYSLLITWSKDRKSIARIQYLDFSKVRIAKEIDEKGDAERYKRQEEGVEFYYISSNWGNTRSSKPELVQGFSEKYNDVATQVVYVKEYRPGVEYYTLPGYISAIDWIQLDKEIANFHLNGALNGFTPSMAINFKTGIPTAEEQNRFHKKIQAKYAGSDNSSKVFITYSENPEQAPDFIPINANDNDQRFLQLEETISTNMAIAHRIPPVVVGVLVSGKLGTTNELYEAESLFQRNVINQLQFQLEETFELLGSYNNAGEMLLEKTEPLSPFILETEIDISALEDDEIEDIKEQIEDLDQTEEKNNEGE